MTMNQKLGHLLDSPSIPIETLLYLSGSSVYAFRHRSKKLVQVFGSTNVLSHLGRTMDEIKTSVEYKNLLDDLSEIDFVILETSIPKSEMKVSISKWIEKYKDDGYVLYKDISPIKLVLETRIEQRGYAIRYCIYAVSSTGSYRKLLGSFKYKRQMKEFLNANYKGDRISSLVVHESASTWER
jgi:hypothetical protein